MRRLSVLVEPILVMMIGVVLGLVDQRATSSSGWLRVPALIASLILVAQAILSIESRRRAALIEDAEVAQDSAEVVVQQVNPGMAVYSGPSQSADPAQQPVAERAREGMQVMYFVMGLAVWLGLATLANPGAPKDLLLLSLLASFLLFSEAYKQMRGRG